MICDPFLGVTRAKFIVRYRANRDYRCDECGGVIKAGELYLRLATPPYLLGDEADCKWQIERIHDPSKGER